MFFRGIVCCAIVVLLGFSPPQLSANSAEAAPRRRISQSVQSSRPTPLKPTAQVVPITAPGSPVETPVKQASAESPIEKPASDEATEAEIVEPTVETDTENEKKTISDGERISRLQRALEKDKAELAGLESDLAEAETEFTKAGQIFNKVDERFTNAKETKEAAEKSGDQAQIEKAVAELEDIERKHALCKERFDLALDTKKGLKKQIASTKEKIAQETESLNKLLEIEEPAELPVESPAEVAAPSETKPVVPANPEKSAAPVAKEKANVSEKPTKVETIESEKPQETNTPTVTSASIVPGAKRQIEDQQSAAEVREARQEVAEREALATNAMQTVTTIDKRQQSLDKSIELEKQLRDSARKQADNAQRAAQEFHEDFRQKSIDGAAPEELKKLQERIQSSQLRLEKAREEARSRSERLDELTAQRHALMSERMVALEQAKSQQQVAEMARKRLEELESPFSRRNIFRWIMSHGPNVMIILAGFLILRLVVKVVSRRAVTLMIHRGSGNRGERENRAETIVGVFQNAATMLCYTGSTLMILEECGVPVGPLLGGAAVVGLAVAFGSQNLIRDYFYGFVILLENQYGVNDVVKIGDITGKVERITLRMTVVRDMEGVNFIPNGRIESVKNLTHGWSRAVFEIRISYEEDIDRMMEILMALAHELRRDPAFKDSILEDPTMQGVERLDESAVVVKFFLKTKPLEQWNVKREMLRRVKKRFDELGIGIPFPQRTVTHRYLPADNVGGEADEDSWPQRRSA